MGLSSSVGNFEESGTCKLTVPKKCSKICSWQSGPCSMDLGTEQWNYKCVHSFWPSFQDIRFNFWEAHTLSWMRVFLCMPMYYLKVGTYWFLTHHSKSFTHCQKIIQCNIFCLKANEQVAYMMYFRGFLAVSINNSVFRDWCCHLVKTSK
jgi:hypothetical protein